MAKQLRNYPIYIAPNILGYYDNNGQAIVIDEISNRNLNPNYLEDKIIIYERQVKEWFLNRASELLQGENNGFIILMIAISYIEGVEQYRQGNHSRGNSRNYFTIGLRRIFNLRNINNNELNDLYVQVRCGLFHTGMTQSKVVISRDYTEAIDFQEPNTIKINPEIFLNRIQLDFNDYINELKVQNNVALRNNFNNMFSNL